MKLPLESIRTDGGTQIRWCIEESDVKRYAADMETGVKFPPVVVFYDGETYWLADGFHRVFAGRELGKKTIECTVKKGTLRDAMLYACGANTKHGLPRKNEDKRQAVETLLGDDEWSKWSNREIAKRCAVGEHLVRDVRKTLSAPKAQICASVKARRGGTEYDMDTTGLREGKGKEEGNGRDKTSKRGPMVSCQTCGDTHECWIV